MTKKNRARLSLAIAAAQVRIAARHVAQATEALDKAIAAAKRAVKTPEEVR